MQLIGNGVVGLLIFGLAVVSAQQPETTGKKRVLVLCTGNSARSQMAAGFLKSFDPRLDVYSAGTQPAARINPPCREGDAGGGY